MAEGGSFAEEVISTIRTAQAFGTQKILARLYNEYVNGSLKVDLKAARVHGIALGCFFFVIYSAYALGELLYFCTCRLCLLIYGLVQLSVLVLLSLTSTLASFPEPFPLYMRLLIYPLS